ncbi:MAG: SusC/RagA family protein, partial [Hymenobacter sp.]
MKKLSLLLFLLSAMLRPLGAFAQAIIRGVVTDAKKGEGLPGVSIVVKGTTTGTSSNVDGSYTLQLPTPEATLIFSFVGYQTVERSTKGQALLNIRLEDQKALDEVVVVGYGTVKRSDLTGSIATVKTDDLLKTIPTSINQGLQGQVAGVAVNRTDGAPGAGISLTIRGTNSFSGSEPLYVIDGFPVYSDNSVASSGANRGPATNALASINPNDIESME